MLEGKVAIVTGASRGIGRAIAVELAGRGADITVNYCGSREKAEETAELIRAKGRRALLVRADVSDSSQVEEMFRQTAEEFGRIDILVNNAGITRDNLLLRMSEEDFDAVINTNLKGAFLCMKQAAKRMLKQKSGRIINISSISGVAGNAGQANYCAAKAGIIGLTKSAAKELGSKGITVNAIAPGYICTDMTDVLNDTVKDAILTKIPLKRFGSPEDIAYTAAFLASDEAAYITGQVLGTDGGMS